MMEEKDKIIIDKVIYAKYLYQKGVAELSDETDLSASASILLFFDAVEMVVLALEDELGIDSADINFRSRVVKLKKVLKTKKLPLERQILEINLARRNFKHGAQLQNIDNVKTLSAYAYDFMNEASEKILKLDFNNISLATLIIDERTRQFIEDAEKCIRKKEYYNSITNSANAYSVFFFEAEREKQPRLFDKDFNDLHDLDKYVGFDNARFIKNSLAKLFNFVSFSLLGVDNQKFIKFNKLTPSVSLTGSVQHKIVHLIPQENNEENSFENAQFCVDFVLDVVLKLQRNVE